MSGGISTDLALRRAVDERLCTPLSGREWQAAELAILHQIGLALNSSLDVDATLDMIARGAARLLGVGRCTVYELDPATQTLMPRAVTEQVTGPAPQPLRLGQGAAGTAALQRHAVAFADIRTAAPPGYDDPLESGATLAALVRERGHRAILAAPMVTRGSVVGVISVHWDTVHVAEPRETALLAALARQAGLALERARLYADARSGQALLERLYRVTLDMQASLEPEHRWRTFVRGAHEVLGFARVLAARVVDGGDSLEVRAVHGLPAEVCGRRHLSPDLGPLFQAVTSKAPVVCAARTDGGRGIAVGDEPAFPRGAYLAVPLIVGDRVIGVTAADVGGGNAPLEPRTIEPFMLLCQQLAAGVREARLYAGAVAREREASAVRDVAAAVARATTDVEMFEPAVARAADVLGAAAAVIHVVDRGAGQLALAVHRGLAPEIQAALARIELGAGPIGRAAATGEAEAVESCMELGGGLPSVLVVPIGSREQVLGTLTVVSRAPRSFTLWEIQLLGAITHQLHVGLTNLRLVADLKVHVERLEAKNAELDSFVYSVSHDLRSPLTTIQGMATVLREDHAAALTHEGQHFLRRIEVNIVQMGRLIADVLSLARIGREARAPEPVDLDGLVEEIVTELHAVIEARGGLVIRSEVLGVVAGVRSQLRQVFANLIGNALKYLGDAPAPVVEISRHDTGGVAEFVVADNGIGIEPAYHQTIFEMFQRLREVEVEGTGIGLPIVKKVVESAGGRVWVDSALGAGARFHFTWPLGRRIA